MMNTPASFIQKVGQLPTLPTIYHEISAAVDNPESSLEEISVIIRRDQSLTTRLLKLANSAFYGFPGGVDSVDEALILIGVEAMRDLALATTVISAFKHLPKHLVSAPKFWQHSLSCAVLARLIAEIRIDPSPERFFLAGLLHDIGRLVMYLGAPTESDQVLRAYETDSLPACAVERRILGFDHATLGAELLTTWRIPPPLVEIVRQHHAPLRQTSPGALVAVQAADFIATSLEMGGSGEFEASETAATALRLSLLDDEQLDQLIRDGEERYELLSPLLI